MKISNLLSIIAPIAISICSLTGCNHSAPTSIASPEEITSDTTPSTTMNIDRQHAPLYIFTLTYTQPMDTVDVYIAEHRAFLDKYYSEGKLIASGPRDPWNGGVILCIADSLAEARSIMQHDPFYINQVADYNITPMYITKANIANLLNHLQ